MSDIFVEVMNENAWACEDLEIEPGIQFPEGTRGICIDMQNASAPIFISSDQLRALADEVDEK